MKEEGARGGREGIQTGREFGEGGRGSIYKCLRRPGKVGFPGVSGSYMLFSVGSGN